MTRVAVVALAALGGAWALTGTRTDGALETPFMPISATEVRLVGVEGARVEGAFRFRNTSQQPMLPDVVWTTCGCNVYGFDRDVVPPGGEFSLRVEGVVPLGGGRRWYAYRVGAKGVPASSPSAVTARLLVEPDTTLRLVVAPMRHKVASGLDATQDILFDVDARSNVPTAWEPVLEVDGVRVVAAAPVSVVETGNGVWRGRMRYTLGHSLPSGVRVARIMGPGVELTVSIEVE